MAVTEAPASVKGRLAVSVTVMFGPPVSGSLIPAGPTAVQVSLESGLVGSIVKMRKLALTASVFGSPRPLTGSGFWKVSDQLLSVGGGPPPNGLVLRSTSVQAPWALSPL